MVTISLYISIAYKNTIQAIMSLKSNGDSDEVTAQQTIQGWLKDIGSQLGRIPEDLSVLNGLVGASLTNGTVDDRKWVLPLSPEFDNGCWKRLTLWHRLLVCALVVFDSVTGWPSLQLEKIIQLACSLPRGSPGEKKLTGELLASLWNNLKHPPLSYMGDEWRYRAADGSNNVSPSPEVSHFGRYLTVTFN